MAAAANFATLVSCNACGGPLHRWLSMPLDAKKNEPSRFSEVLRCSKCELAVLSPLPEEADVPAFYDLESYYTHGESHMMERRPTLADKLLTKAAYSADQSRHFDPAVISLPTDARVCDVGCGHGEYLRQFQDLGYEVVGIDPDPSAGKNVDFPIITGTAERVPHTLGHFDLVLMTHALEHVRDPRTAMHNLFHLTKPGGVCYVEVPNCASEHFQTFNVCSEMFDTPRHIYFFTPRSLEKLATDAGFAIEERLFSGYVRNFSPTWRGWELEIAERIRRHDPSASPPRHTFSQSIGLFLRSFRAPSERKYDSFGFLMRKPRSA